jgi:hypothetical protein
MTITHSDSWFKSAEISSDGVYRYRLVRYWGPEDPDDPAHGEFDVWVMLNPSTADAEVDDPTIKRCMSFSRRDGAGGIIVLNLFAFRATDPKLLPKSYDLACGPENREYWNITFRHPEVRRVVVAWGASHNLETHMNPRHWSRQADDRVLPVVCLGVTKNGSPKHPLYVRGDTLMMPFP